MTDKDIDATVADLEIGDIATVEYHVSAPAGEFDRGFRARVHCIDFEAGRRSRVGFDGSFPIAYSQGRWRVLGYSAFPITSITVARNPSGTTQTDCS